MQKDEELDLNKVKSLDIDFSIKKNWSIFQIFASA